jgi:Concanavalin A-like lectin/glucanases superfamily
VFELVLNYLFDGGTAIDGSGWDNHGRVIGPTPCRGRSGRRTALAFDGIDDRVIALPSESLSSLGGVRALVSARLDSGGQRRTLVEGYLSFSLQVEADASVSGSIYVDENWPGVRSPAGTMLPGSWLDVEFVYDGRDTFLLRVDDVIVANRVRTSGRVDSVRWPFGLTVGAWPDGDRRMFEGAIDEVQVWRAAE